jgi:NhaP-type Na+/H+ and K+/H+ antiporter
VKAAIGLIVTLIVAGAFGFGVAWLLDWPFIVELLIAMGGGWIIGNIGGRLTAEYL